MHRLCAYNPITLLGSHIDVHLVFNVLQQKYSKQACILFSYIIYVFNVMCLSGYKHNCLVANNFASSPDLIFIIDNAWVNIEKDTNARTRMLSNILTNRPLERNVF